MNTSPNPMPFDLAELLADPAVVKVIVAVLPCGCLVRRLPSNFVLDACSPICQGAAFVVDQGRKLGEHVELLTEGP